MNPQPMIIDVRTSEEYAEGHLSGARHLDILNGAFAAALTNLDPDHEYLLYCRSGNRSTVLWALAQAGKEPVADLIGTAAKAGYDISGVRPLIESLAAQAD